MSNFITNNEAKDLKKRLIELIKKSDEQKTKKVQYLHPKIKRKKII